ncbi:acyltransferase [Deinococcus koreensis]|uniref:Acyltransferase n=2 Tax=Deinococcus koreensis TaxID=2054903 RepID=A0A2K3V2V9_9DEIO|nr:acyltransferase [Deinococcus koreensis]
MPADVREREVVTPPPGEVKADRWTYQKRPSARHAVNLFRGFTILEVVLHHSSGMALRLLQPESFEYAAMQVVNRTLHFAVPAFVFLSAAVLIRSLLRRFNLRRYARRRLVRAAWPYLLWSVLYALWYVWTGQRDPAVLRSPERWRTWLLDGKASFHMYFMLVALQAYVLVPALMTVARRRPGITDMLLIGLPIQLGLYFLNREVLHLPYPTSSVLWYILPLLLGVAVGPRLREYPDWWREHRWVILALLAVVYALYLPEALKFLRTGRATPGLFEFLTWGYTSLMALTLMGLVWQIQFRPRHGRPLVSMAKLGTVSLQVYLLHPAILQGLGLLYEPQGSGGQKLLTIALYAVIALLVPALLGRALQRTRLSLVLFGR